MPSPSLRARHYPFVLAAAFFAAGCQDYLFEQQCAQAVKEAEITSGVAKPSPADILFIVDNSGSMYDEQQNLAANFTRFINEVAGEVDFRIAIVTTDQNPLQSDGRGGTKPRYEFRGEMHFEWGAAPPNQLDGARTSTNACYEIPNLAHSCFRGRDATGFTVIDPSTMSRQQQIDTFKANVLVGSCGDGREAGLKSMRDALALTASDKCNAGFLRPDANLVVVIVSDENDTSCDPGPCAEADMRDRGIAVMAFVDDLARYKGGYAKIRVAAIVGSFGGAAKDCRIDAMGHATDVCGSLCMNKPPEGSGTACTTDGECPRSEYCARDAAPSAAKHCRNRDLMSWDDGSVNCGWCSFYKTPDCCSAKAGNRYVEFAHAMEQKIAEADPSITATGCSSSTGALRVGCLIDSICQANFGDTLAAIAKDLVRDTQYLLDPKAIYPAGVRVRLVSERFSGGSLDLVNGTDFQVSPDGTSLTIEKSKQPEGDDKVEIYFVVDTENPTDMPRGACGI